MNNLVNGLRKGLCRDIRLHYRDR